MSKSGTVKLIDEFMEEEEETVGSYPRVRSRVDQFDPDFRNKHVFKRDHMPDTKLIRMKFLQRGDVFRELGSTYIVRNISNRLICWLNFDIYYLQSGGGGALQTNVSGTKSNKIVEYVGYYTYLFEHHKPHSPIPKEHDPTL